MRELVFLVEFAQPCLVSSLNTCPAQPNTELCGKTWPSLSIPTSVCVNLYLLTRLKYRDIYTKLDMKSENIVTGTKEDRVLTTGLHTVEDVACKSCGATIGLKYIAAYEPSQKYKEGTFIIERGKAALRLSVSTAILLLNSHHRIRNR